MSYQVRIWMLVVGDTGSCYVSQNVKLPFLPYVGLGITFADEEESYELVEVSWQGKYRRFVAAVEPWEDKPFPFTDQLDLLKSDGWRVHKDTLGPQKDRSRSGRQPRGRDLRHHRLA